MERKITLMVLSLASVLVLAGFSANEKAYGGAVFNGPNGNSIGIAIVDDLHCYEIFTGPIQPFEIRLVDQFEDKIHDVLGIEKICNPVTKIPSSFPSSFAQSDLHWTSYLLDVTQNPQVIATVLIEDQFHPGGFEVDVLDFAEFLMVPTLKSHVGEHPNLSDIHYKCYTLDQPQQPIMDITQLFDQFNSNIYTELLPVKICNPVEKFSESLPGVFDQFEGGNRQIPEHYLCYDIFPEAAIIPSGFGYIDQFSGGPAQIQFDGDLCTIAEKIIVPPPTVGGSDVSINTSALLLAGAQSISMWMIPVVIAGIGIGIFVIKRRK